jgi:hypothetical protein
MIFGDLFGGLFGDGTSEHRGRTDFTRARPSRHRERVRPVPDDAAVTRPVRTNPNEPP